MNTVAFLGYDCEVEKTTYPVNNQPALQLFAAETGEPFMVATSCLVDYPFIEGETAIKNYSENEGILDVLVNANIVSLTGKFAQSGFCSLPIVKLLI